MAATCGFGLSASAISSLTHAYELTKLTEPDCSVKGTFCSITAMQSYRFSSFEELRLADYQQGVRPPQKADVIFFGMHLAPEQPSLLVISTSQGAVSREQLLFKTLEASLTSVDFRDTVFYLYSRTSSGFVEFPRPVFANSGMLATVVPYFEMLLSGDFVEANTTRLHDNSSSARLLDERLSVEEYGYECDSDLDVTEEDWNGDDDQHDQEAQNSEGIQNGEVGLESIRSSSEASVDDSDDPVSETSGKPPNFLRKICVKDVAFKTWKALVFYIYTGHISFAPLRSQPLISTHIHHGPTDYAPMCSPKSMYRLADKYDLKALKEQARTDIQSKITAQNVVPELFSTFASRYPDVRNLLTKIYVAHCDHPNVTTAMPVWIGKVVRGELPHAEEALNAILRALAQKLHTERRDAEKLTGWNCFRE
ncbi:hypothetical protein M404DRAFT_26602 [Pisolithus tinctorius Marx 270]|uniref:BTB domain-containing protein n=1 Tax=Pisolithus tinctorius Marx 270 TaxID=870435 RepID=A0A0C3K392_PISTI|nr:hypothetical protein M404DRAFT_26602 [Pisolithus tinctorius Marx 270]